MLEHLIPFLVVGGIFATYTALQAFAYLRALKTLDAFEDHLRNITPTETPFMRSLKDTNV